MLAFISLEKEIIFYVCVFIDTTNERVSDFVAVDRMAR